MQQRTRQTVFLPGINADITSPVQPCEPCQPSLHKEPLVIDYNPTRLFESVSADFFAGAGKPLVIVDRLSGRPVVVPCRGDTMPATTLRYLYCYLERLVFPTAYRLPQFTSYNIRHFTDRRGVCHITSPHYPQSNGHIEAVVISSTSYLMWHPLESRL